MEKGVECVFARPEPEQRLRKLQSDTAVLALVVFGQFADARTASQEVSIHLRF